MSVYIGQNGFRSCEIADCTVPGVGKRPFNPQSRIETIQLMQVLIGGTIVTSGGVNSLHVIQELFSWDEQKSLWSFMDGLVIFWNVESGLKVATVEPNYYRWLDIFQAAGVL